MTEQTYPLDLLRAELKAALADQFVQLVDRFVSKSDFQAHERDDEQHFKEINQKLDRLVRESDERGGAANERRTISSGRAMWLGLAVAIIASLITAAATMATYAIWV